MTQTSKSNVVRVGISCKEWIGDDPEQPPSADRARPSRCPGCGDPAEPVGESLNLHVHSKHRMRGIRGVVEAPASLEVLHQEGLDGLDTRIAVRRYRCQGEDCRAFCTVVPDEVRSHAQLLAPTVVMALALWVTHTDEPTAAEVRRWLYPDRRIASRGWPQLGRWASGLEELVASGEQLGEASSRRGRAEQLVQICLARAPPEMRDQPSWRRAVAGAVRPH